MPYSLTPWGYEVDGEVPELLELVDFHRMTGNHLVGDARIQAALDSVSALFRAHCGWHLAESMPCRATLDGGSTSVWLPATNVTALTCVTVCGEDVTDQCQWSRRGLVRLPYSPDVLGGIVVEYVAGFAAVPEELAALVAHRVLHQVTVPLGIQSETIGTTSRTYANGVADGTGSAHLTASDVRALSAYRLWEV